MTVAEAIALRILELCKEKHITVNKLATLSGVTQSTVNSILIGKSKNPGLDTLNRIAKGFEMTLQEFLDFPELNSSELD